MSSKNPSLIKCREIEGLIAVPLIKGFMEECGEEKAVDRARRVIQDLAREAGRKAAEHLGSNNLADLASLMETWSEGGVLVEEILEKTDRTCFFNVTRCRYAELYGDLGIREFGYTLSCCRDEPFIKGFNPLIKFERTQTIMEGACICDFRLSLA
jgi:L-2-amino-thiazoline-4-carboxylic acid hydrolase